MALTPFPPYRMMMDNVDYLTFQKAMNGRSSAPTAAERMALGCEAVRTGKGAKVAREPRGRKGNE